MIDLDLNDHRATAIIIYELRDEIRAIEEMLTRAHEVFGAESDALGKVITEQAAEIKTLRRKP